MHLSVLIIIAIASCNGEMISVKYGEISVNTDLTCRVRSNGIEANLTKGAQLGLWFGYIEYECGKTRGYLISKFECKECGLFCVYNELVPGCKQEKVLFWMGVVIGSLVMIPITAICLWKFHKVIAWLIAKWYYLLEYIRINKKIKDGLKCQKMTGQRINIADPKDRLLLSRKDLIKLKNKKERAITKNDIKTFDPMYIELSDARKELDITNGLDKETIIELSETIKKGRKTRSAYTEGEETSDNRDSHTPTAPPEQGPSREKNKTVFTKEEHQRRISAANAVLLGTAILTSGFDIGSCCDRNMYINSNGKVCDDRNCEDVPMAAFPLLTGQVICYKDTNNSRFEIKIISAYYRQRYNLNYYTLGFNIKTETHTRCMGSGSCKAYGGCYKGARSEEFHNNTDEITGYDCHEDDHSCDNWCFQQASCTWLKWTIIEEGLEIPVYHKVSEIWEVEIQTKYMDIVKKIKINVNNPSIDITDYKIFGINKIPIYITGLTSEKYYDPNGLIIYNDNGYKIKVSEVNMPETDIIGDYQKSIDWKSKVYDISKVSCLTQECKTSCTASQPKIDRVIQMINDKRISPVEMKYIGNKMILETKQRVNAMINVMIGNIDIQNLYSSPAHCDVRILTSYGCTGCNIKPYIVFKSSNIKNEGTLKMDTNCTFSKKYISCNEEPYKIELESNEKYCWIYLPTINKTINVNFTYHFIGNLDPMTPIRSYESGTEIIDKIINSEEFWNSAINTFMAYSLIGILGALVIRVYKIYMINKVNKKILQNVESNP